MNQSILAVPNPPLPRHRYFFLPWMANSWGQEFLGAGTFELPSAQQWGQKRVGRVNTAAVVTVCTLK